MATLHMATTTWAAFQPTNAALNGLPNGAGTIAALMQTDAAGPAMDCCGLIYTTSPTTPNGTLSDWFHTVGIAGSGTSLYDDDGLVGVGEASSWTPAHPAWHIIVTSWPAGGAAIQRMHHFPLGGSWTHGNSGGNNGGTRTIGGAVPHWRLGYYGDTANPGDIALSAAWAGVQLTDAQVNELSVNSKTSDWWNNSGGQPTTLVECNTLTMVDIGANASTFWGLSGTPPTLTGPDPTWTFDGRGAVAPVANPLADVHAGHFGPF